MPGLLTVPSQAPLLAAISDALESFGCHASAAFLCRDGQKDFGERLPGPNILGDQRAHLSRIYEETRVWLGMR